MSLYRDVWIVIPAYNEASVIADVVADVRAVFPNVVCVDDGGRDDTGDRAFAAGAHVVRHPVNLGQGAAIQTGVEYARSRPGAQFFATFDADGQHQVKDVVRMLDRLQTEDLDIVIDGPPVPTNDSITAAVDPAPTRTTVRGCVTVASAPAPAVASGPAEVVEPAVDRCTTWTGTSRWVSASTRTAATSEPAAQLRAWKPSAGSS